jgi:hypothetical protein
MYRMVNGSHMYEEVRDGLRQDRHCRSAACRGLRRSVIAVRLLRTNGLSDSVKPSQGCFGRATQIRACRAVLLRRSAAQVGLSRQSPATAEALAQAGSRKIALSRIIAFRLSAKPPSRLVAPGQTQSKRPAGPIRPKSPGIA